MRVPSPLSHYALGRSMCTVRDYRSLLLSALAVCVLLPTTKAERTYEVVWRGLAPSNASATWQGPDLGQDRDGRNLSMEGGCRNLTRLGPAGLEHLAHCEATCSHLRAACGGFLLYSSGPREGLCCLKTSFDLAAAPVFEPEGSFYAATDHEEELVRAFVSSSKPFTRCGGLCHDDDDCEGDLVCFPNADHFAPPGCGGEQALAGRVPHGGDYCVPPAHAHLNASCPWRGGCDPGDWGPSAMTVGDWLLVMAMGPGWFALCCLCVCASALSPRTRQLVRQGSVASKRRWDSSGCEVMSEMLFSGFSLVSPSHPDRDGQPAGGQGIQIKVSADEQSRGGQLQRWATHIDRWGTARELVSLNQEFRFQCSDAGFAEIVSLRDGAVFWRSLKFGRHVSAPFSLRLHADNNLVLRDRDGSQVWETFTRGRGQPNGKLVLEDSGNLALVDGLGCEVWCSDWSRACSWAACWHGGLWDRLLGLLWPEGGAVARPSMDWLHPRRSSRASDVSWTGRWRGALMQFDGVTALTWPLACASLYGALSNGLDNDAYYGLFIPFGICWLVYVCVCWNYSDDFNEYTNIAREDLLRHVEANMERATPLVIRVECWHSEKRGKRRVKVVSYSETVVVSEYSPTEEGGTFHVATANESHFTVDEAMREIDEKLRDSSCGSMCSMGVHVTHHQVVRMDPRTRSFLEFEMDRLRTEHGDKDTHCDVFWKQDHCSEEGEDEVFLASQSENLYMRSEQPWSYYWPLYWICSLGLLGPVYRLFITSNLISVDLTYRKYTESTRKSDDSVGDVDHE